MLTTQKLPRFAFALPALLLFGASACSAQTTTRKFAYIGAAISVVPRLEAMPGRIYEDFSGRPTDVLTFMRANHFNAWRINAQYSDSPPWTGKLSDDNVSLDGHELDDRERNFLLRFDTPASRLDLARRIKTIGGKIVLTLQFGQDGPVDNWHEYIPKSWMNLTYTQTLAKIDSETRNMLRPYLQASIQPDVIVVENEADSGMLFQYLGSDGKMKIRDTQTNPNDATASGHYQNFPKFASYFKREILSAKDEIKRQGFDPARTRFALHTTTNPFRARSTFDRIFRNKPDADRMNFDKNGKAIGLNTAVPAALRNIKLSSLVDIMGFSVYPPEVTDSSEASLNQSMSQLKGDLEYFDPFIKAFGRYTGGPFKGQWKKQALAVEFGHNNGAIVPKFFDTMAPYEWMMGGLWWEPAYGNNNWSGSQGSLYRRGTWNTQTNIWQRLTPVPWLKTWGSYAQ